MNLEHVVAALVGALFGYTSGILVLLLLCPESVRCFT